MFNRVAKFFLMACILALAILSCRGKDGAESSSGDGNTHWNRKSAETEYKLLQAELRLARTEKPYLVLDIANKELSIRLKGATVWGFPMNISETDSGDLKDFVERFQEGGHRYIRPITEKHLFAYSKETPDSILEIVGKAVNIDPSLMQRAVPERFLLLWDNGLVLDIRTGVVGRPTSRFQNTMAELRRTLQRPFGESQLIMKMTPEEAITLYRASEPGLPTLVYPPH
jgi:hypothetical protein